MANSSQNCQGAGWALYLRGFGARRVFGGHRGGVGTAGGGSCPSFSSPPLPSSPILVPPGRGAGPQGVRGRGRDSPQGDRGKGRDRTCEGYRRWGWR